MDLAYLVITGTTTAARAPDLVRGLLDIVPGVITLCTPNSERVIAPRDLSVIAGNRVVESYFDAAILPRPPLGLVLVAPCSFNSLNKLAAGVADNLALSVVAEAIGRSNAGPGGAVGERAIVASSAHVGFDGDAARVGSLGHRAGRHRRWASPGAGRGHPARSQASPGIGRPSALKNFLRARETSTSIQTRVDENVTRRRTCARASRPRSGRACTDRGFRSPLQSQQW